MASFVKIQGIYWVGDTLGLVEGLSEGLSLGLLLGLSLGLVLGEALGLADGLSLGEREGLLVGKSEQEPRVEFTAGLQEESESTQIRAPKQSLYRQHP